jgi:exosortase J
MSAFPDAEIQTSAVGRSSLSPAQFVTLTASLWVLGITTIWPAFLSLWNMWTADALKSVGAVVPLVSLALILRAWKGLGWRAEGSWWGLAILLVTAVVTRLQEHALMVLVISPQWSTVLPPPSLILFAYGSGVVLLIGGTRLYRAALFPIVLLLFANPVPNKFTMLVDLPLQHASAYVARAFATHLGHSLTPDNLRLMFTPDFGMFIAPGCDGMRGSITMGLIALIVGYVYRFRWYAIALVAAGGVLLGYVSNLLRLCLLVLYYAVALHFPSLQGKARNADYIIGGLLFLLATLLLFSAVRRLRGSGGSGGLGAVGGPSRVPYQEGRPAIEYWRLGAMAAVVIVGCVGAAHAVAAGNLFATKSADVSAIHFPEHIGDYVLARTWNEGPPSEPVVYVWAQYVPSDGGTPIAIGVSPLPNWHDPAICHFARAESALWHGQLDVATFGREPVNFSAGLYNDGVTQWLEASTLCRSGVCGEFATERDHFGFVYTRPAAGTLLSDGDSRATRVLLRVESVNPTAATDATRQQLTGDLGIFLSQLKLSALAQPYSR